jgi:glutamate synthase (NADPH/NADH) large chain
VPPQHLSGGRGHPGSDLRKRFSGQPEHVVNFFFFVAEEVRELMASAGRAQVRRADRPCRPARHEGRHRALEGPGLDYSRIFHLPNVPADVPRIHTEIQDHNLAKALDNQLIELAKPALKRARRSTFELPVRNINRTVGAMLSGRSSRPSTVTPACPTTPSMKLNGTAGQSFGAFLSRGMTLELVGEGNDYVGKGLSGGRIIVRPHAEFRGDTPRTSSSATPCSTAPPKGRPTSPASAASASPCATPAPPPWWKAWATTAANT